MPDRDILLAKSASIQRCLKRIKAVTGLDPHRLDDIDVQDIFVLNVQRAIQSAIDMAAHVIASEGLGLPDTIRGNFEILQKARIIDKKLSAKMQAMVGFRNIAIHDYQELDERILRAILTKHLKDLEAFYTTVLIYFRVVKEGRRRTGKR